MDWTGLYSLSLWQYVQYLWSSTQMFRLLCSLLSSCSLGERGETSQLGVGLFSHSWCWQLCLIPRNSTQVMNLCKWSYTSQSRYEISQSLHSVRLHLHECTQAAPHRGFFCGDATSAPWTTNRVRACTGGSSKGGACYCFPLYNAADCLINFSAQVLLEKFQTASFAELCSITMANKPAESLYHCLNDIYGRFGF